MLKFSTGDELWKKTLESDVEMMPAEFGEGLGEVSYTLDNYRAPLLIDRRLYLFYEGATSYDAETASQVERETFKVNESGLALTEADPVFFRCQRDEAPREDWLATVAAVKARFPKPPSS